MSGTSDEITCPICNNKMSCWEDWKPFPQVGGECIFCGFVYYIKAEQMSLKEINDLRKDYNENNDLPKKDQLKPLTAKDLKKWTEDIKNI